MALAQFTRIVLVLTQSVATFLAVAAQPTPPNAVLLLLVGLTFLTGAFMGMTVYEMNQRHRERLLIDRRQQVLNKERAVPGRLNRYYLATTELEDDWPFSGPDGRLK